VTYFNDKPISEIEIVVSVGSTRENVGNMAYVSSFQTKPGHIEHHDVGDVLTISPPYGHKKTRLYASPEFGYSSDQN